MDSAEKAMILQEGAEFLYDEDHGFDYGSEQGLGGCGEASMILMEAARILGIPGVEFQWGHAYIEEDPGEPIGHAWLLIDGHVIYDAAAWANQYTVEKYEPYSKRRAKHFQSDLKECLIGIDKDEIDSLAKKVARHIKSV
jgi:hypothetical protein